MGLIELIGAEFKLVYGEMVRRRSALIAMIIYPYLFASFTLFFGYAMGSPEAFREKLGVNPVIYMITASFLLLSLMSATDDVLWRPISAEFDGTLPYILVSPVNRLKYYVSIPIPRLTAIVIMGFTSLTPIYIYFEGFDGLCQSMIITAIALFGGLLMITPSILVAGIVHRIGESWRVLNIVRPIMMIFIGVYYPRVFMPLAGRIISSLIPASHVVEFIQIFLSSTGRIEYLLLVLALTISILYAPLSERSIYLWERKKVREGVSIT